MGSVRNAAVAAPSKNLADELGPQGANVLTVHPAFTRMERTPHKLSAMTWARRDVTVAEVEHAIAAEVSIGRLVTAEEVAKVATFLAGPKSAALNGTRSSRAGACAVRSTTERHSPRNSRLSRGLSADPATQPLKHHNVLVPEVRMSAPCSHPSQVHRGCS
ncbi:hypothetical protein GCM10023323_40000 [Streptomyces thinghirensis]|uniref:SDR family NAD(P)-dependent oxidoreductase n=1 Tax=Streptomyces thinghirensis TaxID=551547 RepID=A0ABP9T6Z7_9ACTN